VKKPILIMLLVLATTPVMAQDEAKARRGLDRFLKDALGPGDKLAKIERDPGMDFMYPRTTAFTRLGEFTANVDSSTGDVRFFSRFKPLLYVYSRDKAGKLRTAEDRAAEIERRAHFTLEDSARHARDFLAAHYPDYKKRHLELTEKKREDKNALVSDDLVFIERPAEGVIACWPNRIDFSLNPETGTVDSYIADTRRIESRVKPKVGMQDARQAALDAFGKSLSAKHREWFLANASVELVAVETPKGPVTAWLVQRDVVVDAQTGVASLRPETK
jgi:hypothetical protein